MPAIEQLAAPHLGIDTESAPVYVAKNNAQAITNMLTGRPGRMPVRGSLPAPTAAIWATAADANIWSTKSGRFILARPGNLTIAKLDSAWTVTTVAVAGLDDLPGPHCAQVGNHLYGISETGRFIAVDGGTGAMTTYLAAVTPLSGFGLTYWKNRLWYLGGSPVGGVLTVFTDRVYWSDPTDYSAALAPLATSWQDDVSGLTNQIVLGTVTGSNAPVGFGRLPSGLLILGSEGGDLLRGDGPSNISLRAGAIGHGCLHADTIVEYGDIVMWLSGDGFFAFDGVDETEMSETIRSRLALDIRTVKLASPSTFYASAVRLPKDYIKVIFGNSTTHHALLLHVPTRSWSFMTSPTLTARRLIVSSSLAQAVAYDGQRLWKLDDIVRPDLLTAAGVDATTAGGTAAFTAATTSRLLRLSTPTEQTRLTSMIIDTVASDAGWTVSAADADEATIVAASTLAAGTGTRRRRTVLEAFGDTHELAVTTSYTGGGGAAYAELQDVFVKHAATRSPGSY